MNQFTRNILLWSVIAVAMVSLFGMFSDRTVPPGNSVAYSAFLTQVQNGEVSKVVIDDRNITVATQDGQTYSTYAPDDPNLVQQLKEKNAAAAAAKPAAAMPAAQPAEPAPASDTREIPVVKPAAPAGETREEQIARLRALRAKQLSAEDAAAVNTAAETAAAKQQKAETQAPAEQLRRVEKPAKQIKCPACAVPNPETSGQCYICGTRLK